MGPPVEDHTQFEHFTRFKKEGSDIEWEEGEGGARLESIPGLAIGASPPFLPPHETGVRVCLALCRLSTHKTVHCSCQQCENTDSSWYNKSLTVTAHLIPATAQDPYSAAKHKSMTRIHTVSLVTSWPSGNWRLHCLHSEKVYHMIWRTTPVVSTPVTFPLYWKYWQTMWQFVVVKSPNRK